MAETVLAVRSGGRRSGMSFSGMGDVTLICAVWHKDAHRHALLAAHRENLRRQSVSVHPIYVFDGGDKAPDWLDAETISAKYPLSIYQAWNLALAAVRTPLVMNLNLDDRLAPDAVEKLMVEIEKTRSVLVGGDWRVCYSQEETDDVKACFPAREVSFSSSWPPVQGTRTRLGSGTGDRPTYGPATMWRMMAHLKIPRYPWRFSDGTLVEVIGDAAFWSTLAHFGGHLARLPMIIGNYHSHPGEQAEFRGGEEADRKSSAKIEII